MTHYLRKTCLLVALSMAGVSAQASLMFTFTNSSGGSILGVIEGLLNIGGTQSATGVTINSFGGVTGRAFPASFTVPYTYGAGGSFVVTNGALTAATYSGFRSGNSATQFSFDLGGPTFTLHSFNNSADLRGSSLAFGAFPATVPEPVGALLVFTALGVMGLLARRRNQAQV